MDVLLRIMQYGDGNVTQALSKVSAWKRMWEK